MNALRIVLALLRIPRLFLTLLLFPLALSIVLVYGQLIATGVFLTSATRSADEFEENVQNLNQKSLRRAILYGSYDPLPPLLVCRWLPLGSGDEAPPSNDCRLGDLDVAIQTADPAAFDPAEYVRVLDGNILRLHICRSCRAGVVVDLTGPEVRTDTATVWGVWALNLAKFNRHVQEKYVAAAKELDKNAALFGARYLHVTGMRRPISLTGMLTSITIVMNIAALVIIALFLALKAHRKVLDYFAENGALLPMVAAAGRDSFYSAIWLLTLLRVGAFLLAAVPLMIHGFRVLLTDEEIAAVFGSDRMEAGLWVFAAVASLGLAAVSASVAELKRRRSLLSLLYKFVPPAICLAGILTWALSFLVNGEAAYWVRQITAALPIAGLGPILVAPIFKPLVDVMAVHCVLAAGLSYWLLKRNARWFAAHLEEL